MIVPLILMSPPLIKEPARRPATTASTFLILGSIGYSTCRYENKRSVPNRIKNLQVDHLICTRKVFQVIGSDDYTSLLTMSGDKFLKPVLIFLIQIGQRFIE